MHQQILYLQILVFASNRGLFFHGCRLVHGNSCEGHDTIQNSSRVSMSDPALLRLLLKASQEISYVFSKYVVCCSLTDSVLKLLYASSSTVGDENYAQFRHREFCLRSIIFSLRAIRPFIKLFGFYEGPNLRITSVLDLLEYSVHMASNWFRRNTEGLILMINPIVNGSINRQASFDVRVGEMLQAMRQSSGCMVHDLLGDGLEAIPDTNVTQRQVQQSKTLLLCIPDDEMWQLIGASLWMQLSGFANYQLSEFVQKLRTEDGSTIVDLKNELSILVAESSLTSMAYISSSLTRQLASFLRTKLAKSIPVTSFLWLHESVHHQSSSLTSSSNQTTPLKVADKEERVSLQKLYEISVHPVEICENFANERIVCFPHSNKRFSTAWGDLLRGPILEDDNSSLPNSKAQLNFGNNTSVTEGEPIHNNKLVTDGLAETSRSSSPHRDVTCFHNPVEVLKRTGELLEVAYISLSVDNLKSII